ncbi:DUF481 domain-containing protein [Costertonia aggregata]|uniref:DUF481 domain-containing protein n=1 Tax=Costertonia aggregata TaxID=343403 RepID=A0A7H9AME5_9FLAO|nr:DUF481 domain-containing protein [Costertonia aggregata]QLG44455.1 DUF481 domain-containing protein [Costertonia aggregata]
MTGKKQFIFLIAFLICFLIQSKLHGQSVKDSTRTDLDFAATGNVQTGNFERLQFINQLDFSMDSKNRKWNFNSRHLYLFQKVFENKSQDDYLTRNFLTYRIDKKLDVFGGFFFEKFFIKRININIQYGLGTRYAAVKKSRAFVQFGLMGSYAKKKYMGSNFKDFDNGGGDTIDGFFISPVLSSKFVLVPKRLIFNFLFWFQQDITEPENYRFNLETSLLAPVYKGLSLKVGFNDFYENINLVGAKANDSFLTYGLNFKFNR